MPLTEEQIKQLSTAFERSSIRTLYGFDRSFSDGHLVMLRGADAEDVIFADCDDAEYKPSEQAVRDAEFLNLLITHSSELIAAAKASQENAARADAQKNTMDIIRAKTEAAFQDLELKDGLLIEADSGALYESTPEGTMVSKTFFFKNSEEASAYTMKGRLLLTFSKDGGLIDLDAINLAGESIKKVEKRASLRM